MASPAAAIFAICSAEAVERNDAKAFSLSRIEPSGERRPFRLVVVRTYADDYFGYINACPHQGVWLNVGSGGFYTADRGFLRCGRHGSVFEIESGLCISGPCRDKSLEPVALVVIDGEVCVCGVELEEDGWQDWSDEDDTMDIMIPLG